MRRVRGLLLLALVAACLAFFAFQMWRGRNRGAVHQGWEVAERHGCFACHGAGGYRGMPDPGHGLEDVPPWSGGLITMYADNEAEIREWIEDGMPKRLRADPEQLKLRQNAAIKMPAFRDVLGDAELRAVVAYVKAVSDFEKPQDEKADEGRQVATKFGCFNCHGPQGRGALDNPGSFKGYIPGWDGPDYAELARNDDEAREWILDGCSRRLQDNRLARFFLDRQKVTMPAYRPHLNAGEVDALLAYIHWLRQHPY